MEQRTYFIYNFGISTEVVNKAVLLLLKIEENLLIGVSIN
jgi:hypothetical protein